MIEDPRGGGEQEGDARGDSALGGSTPGRPRRGVTRAYVRGLIFASVIVAASLTVASWGVTSLLAEQQPVSSDVAAWLAPLLIAVALGVLVVTLWLQALAVLRGASRPNWGGVVAVSGGVYLLWCLGGVLGGLSIDETWVSPFAVMLAPVWGVTVLLFWAVLARRVYTDRPEPTWPWERQGEGE